jgi:hypothetical protein
MKKKNLRSKLSLNKKTIANLKNSNLISIKGGRTTETRPRDCDTFDKVCPTETPCNTFTLAGFTECD